MYVFEKKGGEGKGQVRTCTHHAQWRVGDTSTGLKRGATRFY